jgi:hypothetical protein
MNKITTQQTRQRFTPRRNGHNSSNGHAAPTGHIRPLTPEARRDKIKRIIRAKFEQGKGYVDIAVWLADSPDPAPDCLDEVYSELTGHKAVILSQEEVRQERLPIKASYQQTKAAKANYKAELERNAPLMDPVTGRVIPPGHPDYFSSTDTKKQTKAKAAKPRVYLSQAMRDLYAKLRREGENGMLTITQNIANMLALLPPQEAKAYVYMRALMLHPEHPGSFYISHVTLAKNLRVSRPTAERITQNLRKWKLIRVAKRGGSWGAANYYVILPLTQERLDGLRERFTVHSPSPVRVMVHHR